MTIYETDPITGNMTVLFDSRWKNPELLGFRPEEPIYQDLVEMWEERRPRTSTEPIRPTKPTEAALVQSEVEESARVWRHLAGEDISDSPLYHVHGAPTYYGALVASQHLGIERVREDVTQSLCGNRRAYHAVMWCRRGDDVRIGAATSRQPVIATELAFRNAVRHLVSV